MVGPASTEVESDGARSTRPRRNGAGTDDATSGPREQRKGPPEARRLGDLDERERSQLLDEDVGGILFEAGPQHAERDQCLPEALLPSSDAVDAGHVIGKVRRHRVDQLVETPNGLGIGAVQGGELVHYSHLSAAKVPFALGTEMGKIGSACTQVVHPVKSQSCRHQYRCAAGDSSPDGDSAT